MSAHVVNAIRNLREVHGSTSKEIMKYIMTQHSGTEATIQKRMYAALKRGLEYGILRKTNGHYSLNMDVDLPQIPTTLAPLERARRRRSRRRGRGRGRRRSSRRRSRRRGKGRRRSRRGRSRRRGKGRSLKGTEVTEMNAAAGHRTRRSKDAHDQRENSAERGLPDSESRPCCHELERDREPSEDRRSRRSGSQRHSGSRNRTRSRSRASSLRESREE